VVAKAAELAGTKLDAAEAGKLFPFEYNYGYHSGRVEHERDWYHYGRIWRYAV
jgi:hypothetical protein